MLRSLGYYKQALIDLPRYGIMKYVLLPGLLAVAVAAGLFWLAHYLTHPFEVWLADLYPFDVGKDEISSVSNWIGEVITLVIFIFLFKYILLIVMAPFMSHLSERISREYDPDAIDRPFTIRQFIHDLLRGINISVRSFFKEAILTIFILILSFIPGVQIVTAPLLFIIQGYYAGLGTHDYTLERYKSASESIRWGKQRRWTITLIGCAFLGIALIPFIGTLLAVPLATIASAHHFYND